MENDIYLPLLLESFAVDSRRSLLPSSEKKLLLAIIERAVRDFFGNAELEQSAAEDWLFSDDEANVVFSCAWICEHLDISHRDLLFRLRTNCGKHDYAVRRLSKRRKISEKVTA